MRDAFVQMLQSLLPPGQAWTRERTSVLYAVLELIASELHRNYIRSLELIEEADARSVSQMLPDWEAEFGLPDLCTGTDNTVQERRLHLHSKETSIGGQSIPYFNGIAESLGYEVDFTEYRPFVCGQSECGLGIITEGNHSIAYGITDDVGIRFFWSVTVQGPRVTWFQCGASECGIDPLAKIRVATDLECILNRYKPAHTELIFGYTTADDVTYLGDVVTFEGDAVTH